MTFAAVIESSAGVQLSTDLAVSTGRRSASRRFVAVPGDVGGGAVAAAARLVRSDQEEGRGVMRVAIL